MGMFAAVGRKSVTLVKPSSNHESPLTFLSHLGMLFQHAAFAVLFA